MAQPSKTVSHFIQLRLAFFVLAIFLANATPAASASETKFGSWTDAQHAYDAGSYEKAIQLFEKFAPDNSDPKISQYFYNLANSHFRMGSFGLASAYFEKSLRLAESFNIPTEDIRHNLRLANLSLGSVIGESNIDSASSELEKVSELLPKRLIEAAYILFTLLSALAVFFVSRRNSRPGFLRHPVVILMLTGMVASGLLLVAPALIGNDLKVACSERVTLKSGPGSHFLELGKAEVGVRFRLTGTSQKGENGLWVQVKFKPDQVGWVPESSLLLL